MKNAFYFILKALSVLKIFKFLSWLLGHVEETALIKDKVNFKIFDVTTWSTNNYNIHIVQYLTKQRQPDIEIWSANRIQQQKPKPHQIPKIVSDLRVRLQDKQLEQWFKNKSFRMLFR